MAVFMPGYIFEGGGLDEDELMEVPRMNGVKLIDNLWDLKGVDNDHLFYQNTFQGKEHWNFFGEQVPAVAGPMGVSIIRTGEYYTGMVRTTRGTERRDILCSECPEGPLDKMLRRGANPKSVLRAMCPELRENSDLNMMEFYPSSGHDRIPEMLLTLHERQRVTGFKFGILYASHGQSRETEFYCNTKTSPMFDEFLAFLGDRIELDGWDKFKGGLDVRSGSTGKYAVYTEFNPGSCPIIFHVSTYLPFDPHNEQQLERKRHIGNDLVVIVFQDSSDAPFRPSELSSRMIHVVVVIRPVKFPDRPDETWYRMAVISKLETPPFAPVVENVAIFKKGKAFRELLFQKLLNGERACYAAPILKSKMSKTRSVLLQDVIKQLRETVQKK